MSELPTIRDITWVTPSDFSEKKLDIGEETKDKKNTRVPLVYKYNKTRYPFALTTVKDEDAYFRSNGVEEDSYVVAKTGNRTKLGTNVIKLYLEKDNEYHEEFYNTMEKVRAHIKKKIDKETGEKNNVTIKGMYDLVDDDKTVTGHVITAKLIESRKGDVYTAAYDDEEQVDVLKVGKCVTRPALIFGYVIPDDGNEYRISVSMTQMYVRKQSNFPLRDRE
jgi:hypothetical protein